MGKSRGGADADFPTKFSNFPTKYFAGGKMRDREKAAWQMRNGRRAPTFPAALAPHKQEHSPDPNKAHQFSHEKRHRRENLKNFPSPDDFIFSHKLFHSKKNIKLTAVSSNYGQAQQIPLFLEVRSSINTFQLSKW